MIGSLQSKKPIGFWGNVLPLPFNHKKNCLDNPDYYQLVTILNQYYIDLLKMTQPHFLAANQTSPFYANGNKKRDKTNFVCKKDTWRYSRQNPLAVILTLMAKAPAYRWRYKDLIKFIQGIYSKDDTLNLLNWVIGYPVNIDIITPGHWLKNSMKTVTPLNQTLLGRQYFQHKASFVISIDNLPREALLSLYCSKQRINTLYTLARHIGIVNFNIKIKAICKVLKPINKLGQSKFLALGGGVSQGHFSITLPKP